MPRDTARLRQAPNGAFRPGGPRVGAGPDLLSRIVGPDFGRTPDDGIRGPACNRRPVEAFILLDMATTGHASNPSERLDEWVRLHGRAVRGYLLAMVRRPDDAEELAQEVFLRAWKARDRYREQGTARAYLLRIADRLACDRARRGGREAQLTEKQWRLVEPDGVEEDPADGALRSEAARQLAVAMERLSPEQRRVLLLRYYGELRFAEIAEMVGMPLGTVLSHGHRGLETLRKLLVEKVT